MKSLKYRLEICNKLRKYDIKLCHKAVCLGERRMLWWTMQACVVVICSCHVSRIMSVSWVGERYPLPTHPFLFHTFGIYCKTLNI